MQGEWFTPMTLEQGLEIWKKKIHLPSTTLRLGFQDHDLSIVRDLFVSGDYLSLILLIAF